jgi:hypothetical protein
MTLDEDWDPHSQDFAVAEEQAVERSIGASGTTHSANPAVLHDSTNQDAEERARHYAESRGIASINIANDNSVYTRLQETTNYTGGAHAGDENYTGDCNLSGVKFQQESRNIYCCERAAGSIVGDCCNECAKSNLGAGRTAAAMDTTKSKYAVSKETLAKRWNIRLNKADQTLEVTTQKGIRRTIHPVTRRFRTSQPHMFLYGQELAAGQMRSSNNRRQGIHSVLANEIQSRSQ